MGSDHGNVLAYGTLEEAPFPRANQPAQEPQENEHLLSNWQQGQTPSKEQLSIENDHLDHALTFRDGLIEILQFAYPIVLTSMVEFLPTFLCISFVGHIDSPNTKQFVDAATLSGMFTNISALGIGFGLATALDTLCSQAHGAKKPKQIGIYLQAGFLVIGLTLVPLCIMNWYTGPILVWFKQDEEVARLAGEFSRITVFGVPFAVLYEMIRKVLQFQGIVKPFVVMAGIGAFSNVAFGYWLTYHTSLGFHGAALSRTLGYIVLVACSMVYCKCTKSYKSWWPGWELPKASRYIRLFLMLGIPGMFMVALEWWACEITALMAGMLPNPVLSVSAHAVVYNTYAILFMVYFGIGIAGNVSVGNALGANKPFRAQTISHIVLWLAFGVACFASMMILLLRHQIPKLFISDLQAINRSSECLLVLLVFEVLNSLNVAMQAIYRGAGKQQIPAVTNAIAYYVIGLPLAAFLGFQLHWSVEGLWIGLSVGIFTSFAVCASILKCRLDWKTLANEAQERMSL